MSTSNQDTQEPPIAFEQQKLVTRSYLLYHFLSFPFWGFLYLLPMILYKELNATPFQVATLIALKPLVSIFSPYWSQWVHGRPHKLIPNLYWANILKFTPFLFTPFFSNPWYFVFSFGFFMMLSRGTIPSWLEVLKITVPKDARERTSTLGSVIDFLGTALLPLAFIFSSSWRLMYVVTAILGISSTLLILRIPKIKGNSSIQKKKVHTHLLAPWKQSWEILTTRPDFFRFQIGFFLGGAGLMIVQPILPKYFVDVLDLSYTGMLTAIAACKGIGFTLSSPLWLRVFRRTKIFTMCALVTTCAALFPFCLASATWNSLWVYIAYLLYGVMQGGSELSWKMSGILFSKDEDSSPYSSLNVLAVGVRGMIVPYFGSFIFFLSGSYLSMMILGASLSLIASFTMFSYRKRVALAGDGNV